MASLVQPNCIQINLAPNRNFPILNFLWLPSLQVKIWTLFLQYSADLWPRQIFNMCRKGPTLVFCRSVVSSTADEITEADFCWPSCWKSMLQISCLPDGSYPLRQPRTPHQSRRLREMPWVRWWAKICFGWTFRGTIRLARWQVNFDNVIWLRGDSIAWMRQDPDWGWKPESFHLFQCTL